MPAGVLDAVGTALDDVRAAGRVTGTLTLVEAGEDGPTSVLEAELGEAEARSRG